MQQRLKPTLHLELYVYMIPLDYVYYHSCQKISTAREYKKVL